MWHVSHCWQALPVLPCLEAFSMKGTLYAPEHAGFTQFLLAEIRRSGWRGGSGRTSFGSLEGWTRGSTCMQRVRAHCQSSSEEK
ncbi:hypothetical protein JB92DRAFT_2849386 [Gautieria morchelliformis]|nr:hypothetical protein JB92DRAFT_2849386 [Gautieria morchelliformis]